MNKFEARVSKIKSSDSLNLVTFSFKSNELTMISLDLTEDIKENKKVILSVKPTNINIAKNLQGEISSSNKLHGNIKSIEKGKLLTNIVCIIDDTFIETIVTTESLEKMNLKVDDKITLFFKSSALSILDVCND
ncbi:transporter [Arcobacter sp. CECT 8983]|uniref:TOBE domain-containing protein n=1 Tax=Arcobacter sp. CECT 8983 TaxID=2044508 RepID=UPI00100AE2C6|nr:TOBE domain-containing protein [Arcobacter sp. CECT 8983]RXJ91195.1 transporter [Arcobacter sp. CECT 8983]